MAFDPTWLFWTLALGFGLGWVASRVDLRQSEREQRESRRIYDRGLNLLLNEQYDKAIDAFIEVVQKDPDTTELHFALGNLFRRRGELERAVRVHEYLLNRPHLSGADRHRAQHALAKDFMSGGLFDRADAAWKSLIGTPFEMEARHALLGLHERSREWARAAEAARWLQEHGGGHYAERVAHHECELHQEALERGDLSEAQQALERARDAATQAARPLLLAGRFAASHSTPAVALEHWGVLAHQRAQAFTLVAKEFAQTAMACEVTVQAWALDTLKRYAEEIPSLDAVTAMGLIDPVNQTARLEQLLRQAPTVRAAKAWLVSQAKVEEPSTTSERATTQNSTTSTAEHVSRAVETGLDLDLLARALDPAALSQARYRCAACGFETQRHFWQCPGCLNWDTYPARCIDEC